MPDLDPSMPIQDTPHSPPSLPRKHIHAKQFADHIPASSRRGRDEGQDLTAAESEATDTATHAREGTLDEDNGSRHHREASTDLSYRELYLRARELGILGRGQMTKVQLQEAVRQKMA